MLSSSAASAVATPTVASAETTLAGWRRWRWERRGHGLLVDLLLDRFALRGQLVDRGLAAQVETTLAGDLRRLDDDLVTAAGHALHPLDPMVGELGDVHQPVLVGEHLDEGAEGHDANDLALVDLAHLDLVGEALDPIDRLLAGLLVDRGYEYPSIVFDVDLRAGLLSDLADHLASRADDVADLVGVDLNRGDARCLCAHLAALPGLNSQHPVEHEQPRLASLLQSLGQDV